jgi:hypothetical protein
MTALTAFRQILVLPSIGFARRPRAGIRQRT